jgi:hypothetical protein
MAARLILISDVVAGIACLIWGFVFGPLLLAAIGPVLIASGLIVPALLAPSYRVTDSHLVIRQALSQRRLALGDVRTISRISGMGVAGAPAPLEVTYQQGGTTKTTVIHPEDPSGFLQHLQMAGGWRSENEHTLRRAV